MREDWLNAGIKEVIIAIYDESLGAKVFNAFRTEFQGLETAEVDFDGSLLLDRRRRF